MEEEMNVLKRDGSNSFSDELANGDRHAQRAHSRPIPGGLCREDGDHERNSQAEQDTAALCGRPLRDDDGRSGPVPGKVAGGERSRGQGDDDDAAGAGGEARRRRGRGAGGGG